MNKGHLLLLAALFAGVVFASKIRALPGGSHIPEF